LLVDLIRKSIDTTSSTRYKVYTLLNLIAKGLAHLSKGLIVDFNKQSTITLGEIIPLVVDRPVDNLALEDIPIGYIKLLGLRVSYI